MKTEIESFEERYARDITDKRYFGFPIAPIVKAEDDLRSPQIKSVAYFSMEYGLSANTYNAMQSALPISEKNESSEHHIFSNMRAMDYYVSVDAGHRLDIPIYSGGLGVLAGDTVKSAADRKVSLVAIGILWNKGYFKQNFWFKDGQVPEEYDWDPTSYPGLVPLKARVEIPFKKMTLVLRLWKYYAYSFDKTHVIPMVLLDSNIEENQDFAKKFTDQLYRSDHVDWKIYQRAILGIGGVKALGTLGYAIDTFHLNEGHAALAFIEKTKGLSEATVQDLKKHFAYTCHTPVAAGHDRFSKKNLQEVFLDEDLSRIKKFGTDPDQGDFVNLTILCMNTCEHVNAVAQKHGEVTRAQFPQYRDRVQAITNGVHTHTWVSESIAQVLNKHEDAIGNWRQNPTLLSNVLKLKGDRAFREELWTAHQANKRNLSSLLKSWKIEPNVFTVCWARRIAAYKRPSLILQDTARLLDIAKRHGPIQILLAGKAHPKDDLGFTYVNEMLDAIDALEKHRDLVRVAMLENYDTFFGKLLASSVDVWLNNPLPPFEASGTSGMKAILNGVLQLSTLDGWVVEAEDKNVGWIFGWRHESQEVGDERNLRIKEDANALYEMLENISALYYQTNRNGVFFPDTDWATKMIHAIAAAGFFNTDRMVGEYQDKIWNYA